MPATIDLRNAYLSRTHGDIAAIYTWINDERSIVLVPWKRPGAPWYVVQDSAAYKYDDTGYLAQQCKVACEVLGIEPSLPNWVRIAGIIHEGLPDLLMMPPAPDRPDVGPAYGELIMRADGRDIAAQLLRHESSGVTYG